MFFDKFPTIRPPFLIALLLPMEACGPYHDSKSSRPVPEVSSSNTELAPPPYIGAAIFEGGRLDSKSREPLWRLYICFENSAGKQSGSLTIDLQKLSAPYVRRLDEVTATLSQLDLHYSYETSSKLLSFSTSSSQPWAMEPGETPAPKPTATIFNFSWGQGEVETHEETYRFNNLTYYISSKLSTLDYLHDPSHIPTVNLCGIYASPYFLQIRSAIVPI